MTFDILQSVQVPSSGDHNVQTMDEAAYGGKMFYLQMEGGTVRKSYLVRKSYPVRKSQVAPSGGQI